MQDQKEYILQYAMFWIWALAVTACVWYAYDAVLQALPDLLASMLRVDYIISDAGCRRCCLVGAAGNPVRPVVVARGQGIRPAWFSLSHWRDDLGGQGRQRSNRENGTSNLDW